MRRRFQPPPVPRHRALAHRAKSSPIPKAAQQCIHESRRVRFFSLDGSQRFLLALLVFAWSVHPSFKLRGLQSLFLARNSRTLRNRSSAIPKESLSPTEAKTLRKPALSVQSWHCPIVQLLSRNSTRILCLLYHRSRNRVCFTPGRKLAWGVAVPWRSDVG